jgi:hypothetical protein
MQPEVNSNCNQQKQFPSEVYSKYIRPQKQMCNRSTLHCNQQKQFPSEVYSKIHQPSENNVQQKQVATSIKRIAVAISNKSI